MWCVSDLDDEFIERMEEVLDLYASPLDPEAPVVCLDERPVQLRGAKRPGRRVSQGKPARYDYEYVRRGTGNIFCAVEPRAGKHITKVTGTRSGSEFAKMLMAIALRYPRVRTIHLVMDNLSTHFATSVIRHYGKDRGGRLWDRFTVHYTPKHGSWLNQAEIEIGVLNKQCLGNRRFSELAELHGEVRQWNRMANKQRMKIDWKFTKAKARKLFKY